MLSLASSASVGVHASFGRAFAIPLCRRMATLSSDSSDEMVRVRLTLEHPSSFLIVSLDSPHLRRAAFACLPDGEGAHRVEAVWAASGGDASHSLRLMRRWHADAFPFHSLTPGPLLSSEEKSAWGVL